MNRAELGLQTRYPYYLSEYPELRGKAQPERVQYGVRFATSLVFGPAADSRERVCGFALAAKLSLQCIAMPALAHAPPRSPSWLSPSIP